MTAKPRVLFVARDRYDLPLTASRARKFEALGQVLDFRVVASGGGEGDERFRLEPVRRAFDGPLFWSTLARRVAREVRALHAQAIVAQSPYEGGAAILARTGARVVVEVHGDWRTFGRLYGSPLRRAVARPLDVVGTWGVRHADAVRTVSPYTSRLVRDLGVEPAAEFPAYMDLDAFLRPPLPIPEAATALFVGVLEPYKNIDGLLDAWRLARPRVPGATLRIVGDGSRAPLVEAAARAGAVEWQRRVPAEDVARALDEARVLVLPSRSEGMGRVIVEALLRGRPVIGTAVGGIVDLVEDGRNGVLVPAGDTGALAAAIERIVADRGLAERLAAGARETAQRWVATPEEYADSVRAVVESVTG